MAKTENTIELRVIATGAAQAAQVLNTVAASGAQVGTKVSQGADAAKKSLTGLSGSVQGISGLMGQAGIQTGILGQALGALSSPAGLAGVAFVALGLSITKATSAMLDNAKAVEKIMAVSGLSAGAADNLADTFEVLGVDAAALSGALFKMSAQIDEGGKDIRALGVSLRNSQGDLKTEGELFLELRDRISQMGTASERNAALMKLFGRAGRELAESFALSREEFQKWQTVAGEGEWSEAQQKAAKDLARELAVLSVRWNELWIALGTEIVPATKQFVSWAQTVVGWLKSVGDAVTETQAKLDRFYAANPTMLQILTGKDKEIRARVQARDEEEGRFRLDVGGVGGGGRVGKDLGGKSADEAAAAIKKLRQELELLKALEEERPFIKLRQQFADFAEKFGESAPQATKEAKALYDQIIAFTKLEQDKGFQKALGDIITEITEFGKTADELELEKVAEKFKNASESTREAALRMTKVLQDIRKEFAAMAQGSDAAAAAFDKGADLTATITAYQNLKTALQVVEQEFLLFGDAEKKAADTMALLQGELARLLKEGFTALSPAVQDLKTQILGLGAVLGDPIVKKLMGDEAELAKTLDSLKKVEDALISTFHKTLAEARTELDITNQSLAGNREAIERNNVAWNLAKTTFDKLPPVLKAMAADIAKVNLQLADTANAKKWADELASIERQAQLLGPSFDLLAAKLDLTKRKMLEASDPTKGLTADVAELKAEFDRLSDQKAVRDAVEGMLSSVGSAINTLVQGVILGTQKMSDAFKKLGQAIVTEFVNMVIQRALKPLVAAGADVVAALFGFVASAAARSGGGGSIATGITSTGGGGTGLSAGADFGGTSTATNALGSLNQSANTIGASSFIFKSGATLFNSTVNGFKGVLDVGPGVGGLAGAWEGFMGGLNTVAQNMGVMGGTFAGITAAIAIAFTAMRTDITDTGKAVLSAGYAIAGGLAIAAAASGQGYLLLISAGVALVTAILDWTGVFEKASADWLKFSGKLTHTLGLEQDALIAFGTSLEKTTSLVGIAESIEAFRHRIEGAGVGGFFAATAGRGAFTVPGIPGATGTEHEGGLRFDFGPFIQQFQDAINEVLNVVRETISTKMPEIAKTMMPADIADAFISGTLVPLRAEFEALIASGTTTIEQIAAFEEKLNSMGDLMAGFGTAAGAIDILKKGATKALPEDIAPGVIKSADELRAKLLDLAKSGTATKEELEALIGQIQLLSQVAQMMGEAAFVLKELGAVANESLGDLGPTVGASVEKLRAELVALANSGTATAAQLVELQARIAALGSQVALYMRLHDEIAQLSGDIDQVTERMIVNMRASFSAADRAIEAAGEQLAKAIDSPDIAAAQLAMEQAILNRYKLERDLIAQIEETIQDILNQRGPSLITNAMRAVNDALERTDTRPLLHMITALEGVQRASISASAKLWAATAAIQALAAAVPSIVRGFQSQITDPTQFAQALLDAAMPSLETIAGLYGKAIAAGDINSALLALEAGSGAILGLADAAIAGVRQWEAAAVAAAEAAAAAQIDAVNAAAQAQIDAVNATAQADIDRINAEAEAAIEANDARIDALNEERDAIEEMIQLSREWAQVVEDIDKLISDLMTGGASPLNPADAFKFAQQQYQQALAAFQANPTAANAGQVQQTAQAMLQAFQVMRPAGRPSPEYEALVNETVAQLRAIQAFAAGQVTPEEQSLKRLESIDAEIKALNDSNEMIREAADAQIEAIEAARDGQIKAIEAARDLQIKAIETARDVQVAGIHAAAQATVDGINAAVADIMGKIATEQARLIGLQIEQQEKILREITGGKDTQTYMLLLNKTTAGALANLRDMVYASLTGADPPAPNNAPPLARGGIVMKPTYALIGEAGPEVVRPLAQDQARGGTTTLAIENVTIHVGQGQNPRVAGREAADAFERRLIELIRAKPHVRHALRMFLRDGL